jgi:superfamily II DNA/RNA helicase
VFCRTRHGADRLAKQLKTLGVEAAPIHGGRTQPQRDRALQAFTAGTARALVATDVAARGVHVDGVAAVVHYDPPADAAAYVHRSGRTARAGASGVVVSLVEAGTEPAARTLQRHVGIDVAIVAPSTESLRPAPTPSPPSSETSPPATADRLLGTVAFFNARRGYGFIDGGRDAEVFVHKTNVASTISRGQRVEFAVREGRRGLEAIDVVAV